MNFYQLISLLGTVVLLGIAWALCRNKKAINWKTVAWGIVLQFVFALLVLKTPPGRWLFGFMNTVITKLLSFQEAGASFLF